MKAIISLPRHVSRSAGCLAARLGLSRSELYCRAVRELVARYDAADVTERLNSVYGDPETAAGLDPYLAILQAKTLAKYPAEDTADLDAFARRSREPSESFGSFVQAMKRRGVIKN